jgi:hypothetical protein
MQGWINKALIFFVSRITLFNHCCIEDDDNGPPLPKKRSESNPPLANKPQPANQPPRTDYGNSISRPNSVNPAQRTDYVNASQRTDSVNVLSRSDSAKPVSRMDSGNQPQRADAQSSQPLSRTDSVNPLQRTDSSTPLSRNESVRVFASSQPPDQPILPVVPVHHVFPLTSSVEFILPLVFSFLHVSFIFFLSARHDR